METEKIRKIGIENNVQDLDIFVDFLSDRFPHESNDIQSYFMEWADRFNRGHTYLIGRMDRESLEIYERLILASIYGRKKD